MKFSKTYSILLLLLFVCLILLFCVLIQKKEAPSLLTETPNSNSAISDTYVIESLDSQNAQLIQATLRKEKIPEELELGDYWYWIYFDKPALLVNNASGVPMYIEKIQVNPPENDIYDIEDFVNKKVEIFGYKTWGYAESSVFQILSIRKL